MKRYRRRISILLTIVMMLVFIPTAAAQGRNAIPQFGLYTGGSYTMPWGNKIPLNTQMPSASQQTSGVAGEIQPIVTTPGQVSVYKDPVAEPAEYSIYSDFAADPATLYYGYEMAYVIGVDVTNQVITVVAQGDRGKYDRIIRQFICSTGTKDDPTPLGTHYLDAGDRVDWAYFKTYKCYVRYPVRIFGNYFFHSLLYREKDVSSLKSSSFNNLGKRASHGCIRMLDDDVKWMSENCHEGTAVVVYEGTLNAELTKSLKP